MMIRIKHVAILVRNRRQIDVRVVAVVLRAVHTPPQCSRLHGLADVHAMASQVHALALYDWNGSGLQGLQFSSAINRLICQQAERVHSWVERVERTGECW